MIDLYTWTTPNGRKVSVMLEECGLDYRVHPIDLSTGRQKSPEFLAINPNGRIPAIVDHATGDGKPVTVFESGAILLYLAEKTGRFLPKSGRDRIAAIEWLMWQMGGLGPMSGQAYHFLKAAPEQIPYAQKRYVDEVARLYGVMELRLAETAYLGGAEYGIADMACYPWMPAAAAFGGGQLRRAALWRPDGDSAGAAARPQRDVDCRRSAARRGRQGPGQCRGVAGDGQCAGRSCRGHDLAGGDLRV